MSEFVPASHVYIDNPATSVDEVLRFLSQTAVSYGVAKDADKVFEAFKAREAEGTTGMMGGFAIPHAKTAEVDTPTVIVVKFANEIDDWETMDEEKIKIAISLLVPGAEAGTTHLKLLSKVAVMLMQEDFRETVKASEDPEAIAALINENLEDDEDEL